MSLNLSSYQKHLFSVPQKSSPGSSDSTTVSVADSMPWISEAESSKNAHLQSGIQQSLTSASLTKPNLPSELLQPRPLEICEMRNPLEIESMQERTCSAAWEQTREAFVLWDRNQVLLQHLESKLEINLMKQQFIQREYILQWSQQRLREIQVQMDRRVVKLAENLMTQQFAQCRAVEEELHNTRGRGHEIVAGESSFSEDEEQHNDGGKVLQSSVFDTLGHKGEEAVRVLDEGYVSA